MVALTAATHQGWTLAWWDWLFLLNWWQALLVALAITPCGLWAIRWGIQGFWVNPLTHDWASFNCDVFLACGVGVMLWLAHDMPAGSGITQGWDYYFINYGSVIVLFNFAMFKWWDERPDVSTWKRRLGATSLYHVFVLVYFGGLYMVLYCNTVATAWTGGFTHTLARLAAILAVSVWLFAGIVIDSRNRTAPDGQSKFAFTSPEDGWRNVRRLFRRLTQQF